MSGIEKEEADRMLQTFKLLAAFLVGVSVGVYGAVVFLT